jgi:FkbM family methyltransferase
VLARLLGLLNRVPIGERAVRYGDVRLYADSLDRWVAAMGWTHGWMARRETLLLDRLVRPGMCAVDVGANIGFHTLGLARRVGPTGTVHALEPAPGNFRLLARAVRESGYRHVRLHEVAATATPCTVALHLAAANRGDHRLTPASESRDQVTVRGVPLDELLRDAPPVDFLKIDAQGSEVEVLAGARATLARHGGLAIFVELSPALLARAGHDRDAFFGPLAALGYGPHALADDGGTTPTTAAAAWERAAAVGHDMILLVRA